MKIYRAYWETCDRVIYTPCFTSKEKVKDYFWDMIHEKKYSKLLEEILTCFEESAEETENLNDFVYSVLDGWDICNIDEMELID